MLSLIKKGSFESRICISILDLHTTSPYLFQHDAVIMRNGSKFPNFKFPRKPNVMTFRKANELLSIEKMKF